MQSTRPICRSVCVAAVLVASSMVQDAIASTGTITTSQTEIGKTPAVIGYDAAHYLPSSNVSAWTDYSQTNGLRIFAAPGDYEPSGNFGTGINNLNDFETRKAAVSANPEANGFIPWSSYYNNFDDVQSGRNKVQLQYALGESKNLGVAPVLQITRSTKTGANSWGDKWEQYQHFYAMAYWSAKNYGVTSFQMYNEPDQSSASAKRTPADWLEGLKVASDAIRTAISDVNRDFGKTYTAHVLGPTKINGTDSTSSWSPGSSFADYGEAALESNRTDYAGRTVDYDILDTYDLHRYGDAGPAYKNDLQKLKTLIPQYNVSGQMLPVTYTEFNRRNSSSYNGSTDTPDTPTMFTGLATIYQNTISEGVSGLYAFKFAQTLWDADSDPATPDVPQKTGLHYVDYNSPTLDVSGETKSGGVVRLVAKGFKDARSRLSTGLSANNSNYSVTTSYDGVSKNYFMLGVNTNVSTQYDLTVDLTGWDVQPGSVVSVEEVSEKHNGEVTRMVTVPQNKILTLTQPGSSVWLVTAPKGLPQSQIILTPTDDARVRNSAVGSSGFRTTNYGSLTTSRVGRTDSSESNPDRFDYATYVKFGLGGHNAGDISRAIFQVTGNVVDGSTGDAAPGDILFHVYALANSSDNWNEGTITWANAPNLSDTDSKVEGVGTTAFVAGMLTFDETQNTWGVDLTDLLASHPEIFTDNQLSLALVREQRFAGDVDGASVVELLTKESGLANAPTLTLFVPEPGSAAVLTVIATGTLLRRRRQ